MLFQRFILKVINNERKILIHREINDCISQQIGPVITQVWKESKLYIYPGANLRGQVSLFTYSFKFTYFCIVDVLMLETKIYLWK